MLLTFSDKGLYCPRGDFYIDPWRPVERAIITHAHSDHARWGSKHYLCHRFTQPLLKHRLGDISTQSIEWEEKIQLNGVDISLHPAGHIIGSSQVRIEYKGEVWVCSGDYKIADDGISGHFQPIPCHTFITESTFGLPIYRWQPQEIIYEEMREWIRKNQTQGISSVLLAYSLGKAQRVLKAIAETTDRVFVHGAIWNMQQVLQAAGHSFPKVQRIEPDTPAASLKGSVVIAPPSAEGTPWLRKFGPYAIGICSGWMQVRGNARRRNADAGFVLSDHADWPGLLEGVKQTGAQRVFVTHGFQAAFSRHLTEQGIEAAEVQTAYGGDEQDETAQNTDLNDHG